ncbi:hypothetical protein VKT23_012910 [Stygiomarasmius scandens]|uniref:Uncharacterized protein n=1 Tax=Marasmiellus scandens TaxID=2682957 RepID=A0ABR1J5D0_9AGAR
MQLNVCRPNTEKKSLAGFKRSWAMTIDQETIVEKLCEEVLGKAENQWKVYKVEGLQKETITDYRNILGFLEEGKAQVEPLSDEILEVREVFQDLNLQYTHLLVVLTEWFADSIFPQELHSAVVQAAASQSQIPSSQDIPTTLRRDRELMYSLLMFRRIIHVSLN